MAAPYLNEIRTGGELKSELRDIMHDVANRFNVRGAVRPRAVPHVTLFGPYNTDQGPQVKRALQAVLSKYDIVPYRVSGFGRFEDNNVIYANVEPSPELRSLRRDVFAQLKPLTYNYRSWDSDYYYDYHITIAFKDVGRKFDDIWNYVTDRYDPEFEEYATRISSLRRRDMMWEWDVPRGEELRPDEATSADSWEDTLWKLDRLRADDDHESISGGPSGYSRLIRGYGATLSGWTFRRRRKLPA